MTAEQMVAKAEDLPPASNAALKLVNLLGQQTVGNQDVARVLKHDSALTARLLRACNSPILGLRDRISSVDQAVLLLGHHQIFQIVLGLGFGKALAIPMPGYAVEADELWRHSLTTATASELIAFECDPNGEEAPVAFTAGLLHDIGKLVVAKFLTPESRQAICHLVEHENRSRVEAEKEILGVDHCEAGACLLQKWQVPQVIVEAVANHHKPLFEPHPSLSVLTAAANFLAHVSGSAPGWEAYALRVDGRVASFLKMSEGKLDGLIIRVRESMDSVDKFMNLQ